MIDFAKAMCGTIKMRWGRGGRRYLRAAGACAITLVAVVAATLWLIRSADPQQGLAPAPSESVSPEGRWQDGLEGLTTIDAESAPSDSVHAQADGGDAADDADGGNGGRESSGGGGSGDPSAPVTDRPTETTVQPGVVPSDDGFPGDLSTPGDGESGSEGPPADEGSSGTDPEPPPTTTEPAPDEGEDPDDEGSGLLGGLLGGLVGLLTGDPAPPAE